MRDINIPADTDFKFSLERNIYVLGKQLEELLVLPILIERGKWSQAL